MLKFLEQNWFVLGSVAVMAIGVWWRLIRLERDIETHLNNTNPAPHPSCPVHNAEFKQMVESISRIEKHVEKLDNRIFAFMRSNGFHVEGEQ